tara:strand:- start:449 stop:2137 length:1689 start_codon:yes stop_codon:yes gene_type:complete
MKKIFLLLFFVPLISLAKNNKTNNNSNSLTITISKNKFGIDENKSIIISSIPNINDYSDLFGYEKLFIKLGNDTYTFSVVPKSINYSNSYEVNNDLKKYNLYFTPLPIVFIKTENKIIDEPKVLADFVYSDSTDVIVSKIGIEIRGGFSQTFPKKTYDLEFWDDELGNDTKNISFGKLRSDDDWILDALYNEPLRIRSYVANKLWLDFNTPYYINDEPDAKSGSDLMYVEMFLNSKYNGLYNLQEQVDRKQLKLKKYKNEIRGELYKGIGHDANFKILKDYDNKINTWSGWELKYPKENDIIDWKNLHDFTDFIINSPNNLFINGIWEKFDVDNYINYFLFLNLIKADDNTGKNTYLATYNSDEPYFYIPWDLDACFGSWWDGSYDNNNTDVILSNGFFERVNKTDSNILKKISTKWFFLRETTFSYENVSNLISKQYYFLNNNKMYEREALIYPNYKFDYDAFTYTITWIKDRLDFLDLYFGNILLNNEPEIKIYPNPSTDKIFIISSKFSLTNKYYSIYNNIGQLITKNIMKDNYVDISILENGIYILLINDKSIKFIKE